MPKLTEAQAEQAWDIAAAELGDAATEEAITALLKSDSKRIKALVLGREARKPDEVIPPAALEKIEWSVSDPACLMLLVDAAIAAEGDIAAAATRIGCPPDISYALQNSGDWMTTYEKRCHFLITLKSRVRALKAMSEKVEQDGNAYTFKVLHDTAPKDDLTEDEKRRMAVFAGMTRAELRDEVGRHEAIMRGYQERLSAGKSPPPAIMEAVIQDVIGPMAPLPTNTEEWEAQNKE